MPAEWEPHRGTWLSWPHRESSWPGNFASIPRTIAEMIRHLAPGEEVHVNVNDSVMEESARAVLAQAGVGTKNVFFHHFPTNDAWCRDHGPIFVQRTLANGNRDQMITDWGYNAWGGKYPPFDLDNEIPRLIAEKYGISRVVPGMILEGGSIDVNGTGTLLTTEACLLNPNRNPTLSKDVIEQRLRDYLGVTRILWLGDGIVGDDTDGHIDDITRFTGERSIVTVVEDDHTDANYGLLLDNLMRLEAMTDDRGEPYEIVTLPMPRPVIYEDTRLPASYANFYIGNQVVLCPGYDSERDPIAKDILQQCFPNREIVVIDCTELVWGLGAFHCLTQQWPA